METTWIEIGGIVIRAPVTAGTNLALAMQCALYFRRLRAGHGARSRIWSGFFLMMAIATLAGVAKHGFPHELSEGWVNVVLWISNLAGGASTYFAQRASLVFHAPQHLEPGVDRLIRSQLALFLVGNMVLGPRLLLLIVNMTVGLLPVIGVEARAFFRGHPGAGWVAGGLCFSILTGVVYVSGVSVGPWLNHIDIAHLIMGGSLWLMVRGCGPCLGAPREYLVVGPTPRRMTMDTGGS